MFLIHNYKQSTSKTYTSDQPNAIAAHATAITTHTPQTALEPCLREIYAKKTYAIAIRPNTAVTNIKPPLHTHSEDIPPKVLYFKGIEMVNKNII